MGVKDAFQSPYSYMALMVIVAVIWVNSDLTVEKVLYLMHNNPVEISKRVIVGGCAIVISFILLMKLTRDGDLKKIESNRQIDKSENKLAFDEIKQTTVDTNKSIKSLSKELSDNSNTSKDLSRDLKSNIESMELHRKMFEKSLQMLEKGHDNQEKKIQDVTHIAEETKKQSDNHEGRIKDVEHEVYTIKKHLKI